MHVSLSHTHTHTHTHSLTHTHTYTHTRMHTHTYAHPHTHISDDDWGLDMAVELDPTLIPPPFVNYRYVVVDDNGSHPPLPEGGAKSGRSLTLVSIF
jgi:hypothetical protein